MIPEKKPFQLSRWPLTVFLFTVVYGLLHIDFGDSLNSSHSSYGWFFIIFLMLPVWVAYSISMVSNFVRVLKCFREDTDEVDRKLDVVYLVLVLLLAVQVFCNSFLYLGLLAFGSFLGWSTILQLILLPYVDYLWWKPWKRTPRKMMGIRFLIGGAVLCFVIGLIRLVILYSTKQGL